MAKIKNPKQNQQPCNYKVLICNIQKKECSYLPIGIPYPSGTLDGQFLLQSNIQLPYYPVTSLLDFSPKAVKIYIHIIPMHICL